MRVKVVSNINHEGRTYTPDQIIDLPDHQAHALVDVGAAVLVGIPSERPVRLTLEPLLFKTGMEA